MNKVNSAAELREFHVLNVDELCSQTWGRFRWEMCLSFTHGDRNTHYSSGLDPAAPISRTGILQFRCFASSAPEDSHSAVSRLSLLHDSFITHAPWKLFKHFPLLQRIAEQINLPEIGLVMKLADQGNVSARETKSRERWASQSLDLWLHGLILLTFSRNIC